MKQFPKQMLKKPLLLGIMTFCINLFMSTMPVLILHSKYLNYYASNLSSEDPSHNLWMLEQQSLINHTLIYSVIFTLIISSFVTLLAYFLKNSYNEVEKLSHYDGLTGLYNRLMFVELFENEMHKLKRSQESLFLVILDIDDFKPINDTYGHLIGDEAIKTTALTLKKLLRETDTIGRFGGDEFVLCITVSEKDMASHIINRILNEFNHKTIPTQRNGESHNLHINLSIGYTAFKENDDFKTMLHRADQALYISKEAGKNTATYLA